MHKLLERQLRRHFGSLDSIPAELRPFFAVIDEAYEESDADRALLERSLELTSQELLQRNTDLQRELKELEKTQAALRETGERYRRIVETATEGIWVLDEENRTTFVNETMAAMLGTSSPEMLGRNLLEYMDDASRREAEQSLARRRQGISERRDFRFRRKDGSDLWAIVSATPIFDEEGRYKGALGMVADITERRKAEERLRQAYDQLQELVRFRTQFINNTAHELATPLTPIVLQVHLLKKSMDEVATDAHRRGLEILDRNIQRLSRLVSDVLDAARLQSGRLKIQRSNVDLAELVDECVESFHGMANQAGVALIHSTNGPAPVAADATRLSQVLFNLLSNAIKFTPRGGRVRVGVREHGGVVQIDVEDTGIGISANKLPRLFQPFSQLHDTMDRTETGTGLGLYVSRGIVEEHGGRLWCESAGEGMGTAFRFTVPLLSGHSVDPARDAAPPDDRGAESGPATEDAR